MDRTPLWKPNRVKYLLAFVLSNQSHLAPLDRPHPSLLRNATPRETLLRFARPRKGEGSAASPAAILRAYDGLAHSRRGRRSPLNAFTSNPSLARALEER